MAEYVKLFSPFKIDGLTLSNRLVFPPFETNYATEDSFVTENILRLYARIARGGVGLIIVEASNINPEPDGKYTKYGLGAYDDKFLPGLRRLVERVHDEGPCKIALQIVDKSLLARQRYVADLTVQEIRKLIDYFVEGVVRVREAGFGAVEYHWAHPYTGADFLSKRGNARHDEYGGTVERRMRMNLEVVQRSREAVGKDFPIIVRFNADDFTVGGNTLLHTTVIAKKFEEAGASVLDVSCGGRGRWDNYGYSAERAMPGPDFPDGVNVYLAEAIKKAVKLPIITVGKINTPQLAEQILQENKADLIAIGRALFRDPDWPNKAKQGQAQAKEILECNYCNYCHAFYRYNQPVICPFKDWLELFDLEGVALPSRGEMRRLVQGYRGKEYAKPKPVPL